MKPRNNPTNLPYVVYFGRTEDGESARMTMGMAEEGRAATQEERDDLLKLFSQIVNSAAAGEMGHGTAHYSNQSVEHIGIQFNQPLQPNRRRPTRTRPQRKGRCCHDEEIRQS